MNRVKAKARQLISLLLGLLILALIYWRIDASKLLHALLSADPMLLALALFLFIPQTLFIAIRFKTLIPPGHALSLRRATSLFLTGSVLNLFLPSKMGDLAKAYFLARDNGVKGELAFAIVLLERLLDLLALMLWGMVGLLLYPERDSVYTAMQWLVLIGLTLCLAMVFSSQASRFILGFVRRLTPTRWKNRVLSLDHAWRQMQSYLHDNPRQLALATGNSLWIWFLHLLQIWLFILALHPDGIEFLFSIGMTALSLLAGLLPLTLAGIGVRDAALIFFYQGHLPVPVSAALGVLCTVRYLIPALVGVPFFIRNVKNRLAYDEVLQMQQTTTASDPQQLKQR